jgi:hypothetical protein
MTMSKKYAIVAVEAKFNDSMDQWFIELEDGDIPVRYKTSKLIVLRPV